MKAILCNERMFNRLKTLLVQWGSGSDVLISSFFFRPGMSLQKSQLGFLQSIVYQILSQRPTMIDRILSSLERSQALARLNTTSDSSAWSLHELKSILRKWSAISEDYLYIHVDGIDEIDCAPQDLATLLLDLSALSNVKILAAGRYHAEFDAYFSQEISSIFTNLQNQMSYDLSSTT